MTASTRAAPTQLQKLTDVTGTPSAGTAPVYGSSGVAVLTPVVDLGSTQTISNKSVSGDLPVSGLISAAGGMFSDNVNIAVGKNLFATYISGANNGTLYLGASGQVSLASTQTTPAPFFTPSLLIQPYISAAQAATATSTAAGILK